MNISKSLKTGALAIVLVVATASASLAATAWMDQDSSVRHKPFKIAKKVNWVHEGQKVHVVAEHKGWYKIKIPGKDGWVHKGAIDFKPDWDNDWDNAGASFCIKGDKAQFCISGGN